MPDPTDSPAQLLSEQYDHGDVSPALDTSAAPPAAQAAPTPAQPREPDGTFAKPAHIVQEALRLGMARSDVDAARSADLREWVRDHQLIENSQLLRDLRDWRSQQKAPETPTPVPAAPAAKKKPRLDPEKYDSELAEAFNALADENEQLREELGGVRTREQQRELRSDLNQLDTLFSKDAATFGQGATEELDPASPEAIRRNTIMMHLWNTPPEKRATLAKDYAKFRDAIFGAPKPAPEPPPAPRAKAVRDDWYTAGLERPSGRTPPPMPKGVDRAVEAIAPLVAQLNGTGDPDMPE